MRLHPSSIPTPFVPVPLCTMFGQHVWTYPHNGRKPNPELLCSCGEVEFGVRPAPPAVRHTGRDAGNA